MIYYNFNLLNSGNVTLYDPVVNDPIVTVFGSLDSLPAGESNATSFTAVYTIRDSDAARGYVENSATVMADTPTSLNGQVVSDVSDVGNNSEETPDGTGQLDNDPTNDPVILCVEQPTNCLSPMVLSTCLSQEKVDLEFQSWLALFSGGGCIATGAFAENYQAPDFCGGRVDVVYQLVDAMGVAIANTSCNSYFEVIGDQSAPICPTGWEIVHVADASNCFIEPYASVVELENSTGLSVNDDCSAATDISLSFSDQLIREECSSGFHFEERTVIRNYTFTDQCGFTSDACPQEITYQFNECVLLSDYGKIAINDAGEVHVPVNCTAPDIVESEEVQGVCGYVEYMWLITTEVDSNGDPVTPTNFNIGTIWKLIPGEFGKTLSPGVITEDTYFVRCARNFSCCDYGESNIVSILIDNNADCPGQPLDLLINEDCDDPIILSSPTDDYFDNQQILYRTDESIRSSNKNGAGSQLILSSGTSTTLTEGFVVEKGAILQVDTTGCQ